MNSATPQSMPRIIRAAGMIDGKGGEPLTNYAIVVQDGWIQDIQPWEDESIASLNQEAEVIDVEGATLLPGLIDAHVHLTLNADTFSADREPTDVPTESDESILLRAVGNAQAALGAGVTTVCDCGGPNHLVFALRDAIKDGVKVPAEYGFRTEINMLALGDDKVLSFHGNQINEMLKAYGLEVFDPDYSCFTTMGGGPRCSVFELERER
jgi:imidazolonepropionase-like amidohydrolase